MDCFGSQQDLELAYDWVDSSQRERCRFGFAATVVVVAAVVVIVVLDIDALKLIGDHPVGPRCFQFVVSCEKPHCCCGSLP